MVRKISFGAVAAFVGCSVYEPSLLTGSGGEHSLGGSSAGSAATGAGGAATGTGARSAGGAGQGGAGQGASRGGGAGGGVSGGNAAGVGAADGGDSGAGGALDMGGAGASGGVATAGDGGDAGAGGASAGAAGDAGQGGTASGGDGGAGGAAGQAAAGDGGAPAAGAPGETCTGESGCARLAVPLGVLDDRTLYSLDLGAEIDFSDAVINYRVYRVAGTGGRIWAYIQHGGTPDYNLIYGGAENFSNLDGWVTVTWDVASSVPPFEFDKSVIRRLGVEIVASGTGPWANPTVVYLDSITVTSSANVGPWEFDDAASVSSAASPPAADIFWLSTSASEAVPGSTLDWIP